MKISKEIIEAFFAQQCTPEEAKRVRDYLSENPDELEKYLPASDWGSADVRSLLPESFWKKQWEKIQAGKNRSNVIVMFRKVAVAAILVLSIGAAVFYFTQRSGNDSEVIAEVEPEFKTLTNQQGAVQRFTLSDGSAVELSPEASLTFKEGFEKASQDIVLKGEAVFSVAKDSTRPFTVYSGNISTTALGTKFKVIYWNDGTKTRVHLYEGKVLVKSAQATNKKESYLLPGDVLSYHANMVRVSKGDDLKEAVGSKDAFAGGRRNEDGEAKQAEISKKQNTNSEKKILVPNWYRFEKESVANVFEQLSDLYNVRIDYDAEALQHKYFIGRFEKEKTIDHILKTIADLNHLKVEKIDERHFIIK